MLHYRSGRAVVDQAGYPEMDAFWHDLAEVCRKEIAGLAVLGCPYLPLGDTSLAYLNDPSAESTTRRNTCRSTSSSSVGGAASVDP
jgi:5-methyltetrahydropteroyltriglutamate--homocysteine methyltransferase